MAEQYEPESTEVANDTLRMRVPVEARAADDGVLFGAPESADLRLINKLALGTLSAEEVFVFDAVISNNSLDAYFTHMAPTSLRNYVKDAKAGVAVMNSHRTGFRGLELPIGRSFRGELQKDGDVQSVLAAAYMRRGGDSNGYPVNSIIDDIRAGIVSDVSIGFRGGRWICDSCGNDYFSWDCGHWAGGLDADGNLVTVTIEDANLGEFSLVYDGATPGAAIGRDGDVQFPGMVVRKAERMAAGGLFTAAEISKIEDQLHARLLPVSLYANVKPNRRVDAQGRIHAGSAHELKEILAEQRMPNERTQDMTGAELIAALLSRATDLDQGQRDQLTALQGQLNAANGTSDDALAGIADLLRMPATANPDPEQVARIAELEREAADGRAYRESLITETLAAGVRAMGTLFRQEMWERTLRNPAVSVDDIRGHRDTFEQQAQERLGSGGRRTGAVDPNDPSGLAASITAANPPRNASAYSVG